MDKSSKERGQVLVLIILAIAVIFGFAALAVDVGRLYSERRRAQSAADAAAYAAAFASSQGDTKPVYLGKGLASAVRNGFIDDDYNANIDKDVDVQVYNPPISGKYSVATGTIKPSEYYQVFVRTEVDKVFSQFVYNGPWFVTVEAIARSTAKKSVADGNVIVATCPNCCDGVRFSGNPYVMITGGDITSNSVGGSNPSCNSGENAGTGCIIIEDGGINVADDWNPQSVTSCKDNTGATVSPPVQVEGGINEDSTDLWSYVDPGMPGCLKPDGSALDTISNGTYSNVGTEPGNPLVLGPGIYPNGIAISGQNSVVQFEPGMYCLDGDLSITSGSVTGDGVMFVMRPKSPTRGTNIDISTGQTVVLTAPGTEAQCIPDPKFYDQDENFCWSGFLFFSPYSNVGTISIQGGNSTTYEGTIFAPGPARPATKKKCVITGNSETMSVNASIICYNVSVEGTGTVDIHYYDKINAQQPAMIELAK